MRLPAALLLALATSPLHAEPPRVVADIAPVASLLGQVMAGVGTPQLLLDGTASPHAVQLKPSQVRMLDEADLLVWVGPELSPWLERMVTARGGGGLALTGLRQTRLRQYDGAGGHDHTGPDGPDGHDHADHADPAPDDHDHSGMDPHVWLSTDNARAWLDVFAEALAGRDPDNADTYRANAATARAALDALDARIEARLAAHAGAEIVTFHDSLGYFAERYGIEIAGTVRPGDASAPSAAALEALRGLVADHGVQCAFTEPGFDPGLLDAISGDTGLRIGVLDPTGALQPAGPGHYGATLTALSQAVADCLEAG